MKVELIKQTFNNHKSFKFKPIKYCCEDLKNNPVIELTDSFADGGEHEEDDDGYVTPYFAVRRTEIINSWEDEWEDYHYYKIDYCPFCGEPIEISIIEEEDVSEIVNELEKQRKEAWNKYNRTDSKKKAAELQRLVHELDDKINYFYELLEHNESVSKTGE